MNINGYTHNGTCISEAVVCVCVCVCVCECVSVCARVSWDRVGNEISAALNVQ